MEDFLKKIRMQNENFFADLDRNYPNRQKEIHKQCCANCPSRQDQLRGFVDPESEMISKLPKEVIAKNHLFVCYARNSKLCKGLCDNMGIDEEFLKTI